LQPSATNYVFTVTREHSINSAENSMRANFAVNPGYVYVKPTAPNPDVVVVYEAADDKDTQVNVGFGDGHVEAISKDDLKAKLAAPAAAPGAAPGGMGQPAPAGGGL
jgi:prepilin-type processing-associated H-X9-DG protein